MSVVVTGYFSCRRRGREVDRTVITFFQENGSDQSRRGIILASTTSF